MHRPQLLPHLFNKFGASFRFPLFPIRVIQHNFFFTTPSSFFLLDNSFLVKQKYINSTVNG